MSYYQVGTETTRSPVYVSATRTWTRKGKMFTAQISTKTPTGTYTEKTFAIWKCRCGGMAVTEVGDSPGKCGMCKT